MGISDGRELVINHPKKYKIWFARDSCYPPRIHMSHMSHMHHTIKVRVRLQGHPSTRWALWMKKITVRVLNTRKKIICARNGVAASVLDVSQGITTVRGQVDALRLTPCAKCLMKTRKNAEPAFQDVQEMQTEDARSLIDLLSSYF